MRVLFLLGILCFGPAAWCSAAPFEFQPADRVVLVGGTLIEREQRHGYWEAALTAKFPDLKFRNLGWSGDTVFGDSRRRFEVTDENIGRRRLVELALAEKPTVLLICYGTNESYEGMAGLKKFIAGYERLLDELAPSKARVILISPPPLEAFGAIVTDPAPQNKNLALYRDAIKELAAKRGAYFADLFAELGEGTNKTAKLTDNGLHFGDTGYRDTTGPFLKSLGLDPAGGYSATLDPLRQIILEKNELYFHRWRPQNETYLFGFRKHEQGKNGKEIAEFDPLIAAKEADIGKLLKK
ncbi:SGNH/GDSL hydrolase family protein [Zavarzinella formosa]|uniref:SGNH/GDSL hydrolase family protein n=1 Tax=Zavarzinella formosa TaxID=360055 RepID=UPI0002FD28D0|nr:SGNH/GDSL hydrolase family protein [Zavarzinella formosa]